MGSHLPFTSVPPLFPTPPLVLSSQRLLRLAGWRSIHSAGLKVHVTELVGRDSHKVDEAALFIRKIDYFKSPLA